MCQAVWSLRKPRVVLRSCGPLTWSGRPSLPARPQQPPTLPSVADRPGPQERSLVMGPKPRWGMGF